MTPRINIQYNKFLDPIFIGYLHAQEKYKDWIVPSREIVDGQVAMYKAEWAKYGGKILEGMCRATGLSFKRNTIDVFVVSGNPRPFSRPVVLKSRYTAIEFLCHTTHELIHCLFADHDDLPGFSPVYPHEDPIVSKHVIVHAVLKYIYLDVLGLPDYLKKDVEMCKKASIRGYDAAWDIVEKEGYSAITEDFRIRMKKAGVIE